MGREEDSDQRCQDFYFQNFFPKNLAKKLGRVLQPEISGMVCVRVRSCSTPPPFRADEKHPGGLSFRRHSRSVPAARAKITNFSSRRIAFLCHISATLDPPP